MQRARGILLGSERIYEGRLLILAVCSYLEIDCGVMEGRDSCLRLKTVMA